MKYENVIMGRFLSRPNRFIAHVDIDGKDEICHVKNTGRLGELLIPGRIVYLQECDSEKRKTGYDVIAVEKDGRTVNIDSLATNKCVTEWIEDGGLFGHTELIRPEYTYKDSRFDVFCIHDGKKTLIEVKGVTLEKNGTALFPDAPTVRGARHLKGLIDAVDEGYECYVIFVIQMKGVYMFSPNTVQDRQFSDMLKKAYDRGVSVLAFDCIVSGDSIRLDSEIPVVFR